MIDGSRSSHLLADRVSRLIGQTFALPPAPSLAVRVGAGAHIAFSHFQSLAPRPGMSVASPREEAFVFNVPLKPAHFPVVSIDGTRQSVLQEPGKAYLFDLTSRNEVSLATEFDSIRIHLTQAALDHLADANDLRPSSGLRAAQLGQDDAILHRLALLMLPVILDPRQVSAAFLEHAALAVHDHVVRQYGAARRRSRRGGGLAAWQLRRTEEFVRADRGGNLSISDMAQACGLSASYFAEAFKRTMGVTPHQWLLRRRVDRAKDMLRDPGVSLASIAAACGFFDQSHFSRVFLRHTQASPGEWRRARLGTRPIGSTRQSGER